MDWLKPVHSYSFFTRKMSNQWILALTREQGTNRLQNLPWMKRYGTIYHLINFCKISLIGTLLTFFRCSGSVGSVCLWTSWIGSVSQRYGSGSFHHREKIVRKNYGGASLNATINFGTYLLSSVSFLAHYFLKIHLHQSSQIISPKEVTIQ